MAKFLQDTLEEMALQKETKAGGATAGGESVHEFSTFLNKVTFTIPSVISSVSSYQTRYYRTMFPFYYTIQINSI